MITIITVLCKTFQNVILDNDTESCTCIELSFPSDPWQALKPGPATAMDSSVTPA